MCEIRDLTEDGALIKLQNGNSFLVAISEGAGKLKPGDTVLAEQKNLTVVRKVGLSKKFDVEKYVIIENLK